jgi:WD40 repeat protein
MRMSRWHHACCGINSPPTRRYVFKLAASADGGKVAAACQLDQAADADQILLFDAATGQLAAKCRGHTAPITDIEFFAAEQGMLSCAQDGTARIWDARAGTEVRKLKVVNCNGSGAEVYSAAIGLADTVCASAASEVVHLWDIGTAKRLHVYTEAHTDIINKVRFHPTEAHMLMSAGDDNLVVVRDARILDEDADGCLVAVLNNEDGVRDFSIIGPASDILCTFSTTEVLRIWSLETSTFGTLCAEHSGFRHDAVVCDGDSCGYAVDLFYDQGSQSSYALCGSPAGSESDARSVLALVP